MNKPLIILGAGGHAGVLADVLRNQGRTLKALVAPARDTKRTVLVDIPYWSDEEQILTLSPDDIELVNGVGSLPGHPLRAELFARYHALGYRFAQVISPRAIISDYAVIEEGVQVMAGAIIQAGVRIGKNTIINTGATVDHDCVIGENNHIAPGAVLSGGVLTGVGVHISTGAAVIQGISIGDRGVVAAGATLTCSIEAEHIAYVARGEVKPINKRY